MRIKRMVKRLFAVTTGVAMLGATAMGALAADLGTYPDMFVDDGTFNGYLVIGRNALADDNVAITDVAVGMKFLKAGETSSVSVEGDAWEVGTSAKYLEMADSNASDSSITGEQIRDIATFIGEEELGALADGTFSTNEQDYDFQQFLFFDASAGYADKTSIVKYTEDDEDITSDFFYVKNSEQIARYKLEFTSTAQSDVTDSTGTADTTGLYLDDFEDTTLSMMGQSYSIVQARRTSVQGDNIKLVLMSGSTKDTLVEGDTKTYAVEDKEYEVTLSYVDDTYAKFTVNGESTSKLKDGDTYVLSDKSEIGVSEVLYQGYAGGIHSATFYVGAQKIELKDGDIDVVGGSDNFNMKVGSENIDGTTVIISGSDDNTTFTVTTIEINMSAEDDFFVPKDGKLSEVIATAGEEQEVLMANNYDIEYKGLADQDTHELKLKTSGSRRYKLQLFDGDNNQVDIPVAYAEAQYNVSMGEAAQTSAESSFDTKKLVVDEGLKIYKNDYFILTGGTASDGSAKSYLMQYKGADNTGKTSPKIKFKNAGSGETMEYSVSSSNATATIKLGGYSFAVHSGSDMASDDFAIMVDLNGGGYSDTNAKVQFVDYYGSQWLIYNFTGCSSPCPYNLSEANQSSITINMTTPNGDDFDTVGPSVISLNLTSTSGPELRAAYTFGGTTNLITPDGETEVSYGYNSMGAFLTFSEPSSDPDELTIVYPAKQRLPQLYITSGATTTSTSGDGTLTQVTIVDAVKFDDEIADTTAQNLIVVGGPCVNTVAAELMGNPADCAEGFTPGKSRVKLYEHANGNVAMLVAGYSGADTRLAGKVVAHRWDEFSGEEVEVEGTTYSDATIGAPTVVEEVAEVVEEEAAAE